MKRDFIHRMPMSRRQNIFIGHGRSPVWLQLKDFLAGRLHFDCDEFNAIPVAGRTTVARLQEMLELAWFAFLVMTGEDVHVDGDAHARENVVHEAGLFQGRLGFERAIILLEDGCAEFSNIDGLTTIRFPKGDISPAFEEIRRVLERETATASGSQPTRSANAGSREEQLAQDQQRIVDEIQYMTDDEREIIAYLLAHNQRMFTNTPDCGHASTLVSKGIVVRAVRDGQVFTYFEMPFRIPDHVWDVLKRHQGKFPYDPPPQGKTERHPWRRGWME
jgi:hypothetical protein